MGVVDIGRLLHDLADFCYPGRCAACDGDCAGRAMLCRDCDAHLDALETATACSRCAMPLAAEGDPCPYCRGKGRRPFQQIVRLGVYRDPLQILIHRMKYNRRWALAEQLAERLLGHSRVLEILAEADCIVPVPLHRYRQISRGYNQAQLIAGALTRLAWRERIRRRAWSSLPIVHPAVRLRHTETQTQLGSRAKRMANVRDAFGLVRPRCVAGKHVVVVDDVMTTGATLRALGRTLQQAGPASLNAIVIAIADPIGRDFQRI